MSNTLIAYGNEGDTAVLSGGSWLAELPLSNLQNEVQARVARSADASQSSTWFDVDMLRPRMIRAIALPAHNLSLRAGFRIRGAGSDPDFVTTVFDSGELDVWPTIYPFGTVPFGADNWWGGKPTERDRRGLNPTLIYLLPQSMGVRRLRFEFFDEGNADGYIQIGRLFVADGWQPEVNVGPGAVAHGWEDQSLIMAAMSGAEYKDRRAKRRTARFAFEMLTEAEAMRAHDLMRLCGTTEEVLYVHDPDDTTHAMRRRWLGRLRQLNAVEYPRIATHPNSVAFEHTENL